MTTEEAIVHLVVIGNDLQMNSADTRGKAILVAISALEKIDRIMAERDAAIGELRRVPLNCFCCRWNSKIGDHDECQCPELCCLNGPDRWEWRGIKK